MVLTGKDTACMIRGARTINIKMLMIGLEHYQVFDMLRVEDHLISLRNLDSNGCERVNIQGLER